MASCKVINAEPFGYSGSAVKKWKANGFDYIPLHWDEMSEENYPGIEGLIVRLGKKINSEVLNRFPSLKFIVSATTGLDHIEIAELNKRNIQLFSLRGETEFLNTIPSTAELTWGLILSLVRNIPQAYSSVMSGEWTRDAFRGYQLTNKVLGIIGMGRTGKKVAKYAMAFGMRVNFYDPYVEKYDDIDKVHTLETLLKSSDIVSLHVHLKEDTRYLINEKNLKHFKPGAYMVNTSRGALCKENDVVDALRNDVLKGVATDVLETELNTIIDSPLYNAMKKGMNVIITPHIGGASWDAMWMCEEFMADKVIEKTL